MQLLDGKLLSQKIQQQIADEIILRKNAGKKTPHLAAILVGDDGASQTYVNSKVKSCDKAGMESSLLKFESSISESELLNEVYKLNESKEVDGFIVQLPLPKHINAEKIVNAISPLKDIDGFHPVNVGNMVKNLPCFVSATPYGILLLLEEYKIQTEGKHCVVIGRSDIVGKPMSILMSRNAYPGNCTVTLAHSKTKNLSEICLQADILVAALGKPEFVKKEMVKSDAVVIDVGITRLNDASKKNGFRLVGDVDFENVAGKCSYITPVPGGVGPMTIAALMKNTMRAVEQSIK
jgi:methylenetetrahydrofolate dehydrogenase (NADP+) / methenyltetrahydrofolate cyclohydrolase